MEEAAAGKARLPTVESLTDGGTIRRLVAAERRPKSDNGLIVYIRFLSHHTISYVDNSLFLLQMT